jgi:cardiolipin synthase
MFDNVSFIAITLQIVGWILNIVALIVVPRNRKPTAGMAWLLIIFLVPYLGWIVFLLLGTYKLPKNRRDSQRVLDKLIDKRVGKITDQMIIDVPAKYRAIAKLATSMGHLPPLYGNVTHYIAAYDGAIQSITDDIRGADISIYIEYFILTLDDATEDLFNAMKEAAARGVEVRVLYDWWGSRKYKTYKKTLRFMKDSNIKYHAMLPLKLSIKEYLRLDLRNHRKIVIIDHEIGYVGSQNIIRRNYSRKDTIVYDELVVRLSGTIINALKALFAYDWSVESHDKLHHILNDTLTPDNQPGASVMQILPSGPSYNDTNNLKVFNLAINRAEHEIFIANPYFVPSESLLSAIVSAAKRGVKVRMINSEAMDQWMVGHAQRSYYEELLVAGIEVYLYKKPTLLHSKFMIIDNEIAFVGSSNMDMRSFELDQEVSLILYEKKDVKRLQKIRDAYLKNSSKIILKEWRKRKLPVQFLDSITRLTSNLQ